MMTFYMIGLIIAFILGLLLVGLEEDKKNLQYGMLAPLALLSWISVGLILYHFRKRLIKHYLKK